MTDSDAEPSGDAVVSRKTLGDNDLVRPFQHSKSWMDLYGCPWKAFADRQPRIRSITG